MMFPALILLAVLVFLPSCLGQKIDPAWSLFASQDHCEACASLQDLRASAFGIELTPDWITYAAKLADGLLAPLVRIDPGSEVRELMISWMRESRGRICSNLDSTLRGQLIRQRETEVIADGFRHLLHNIQKSYPAHELEYGGVAIPEYIYRNSLAKDIVDKAINDTGIRNSKNEEHFVFYPSEQTVAASGWMADDASDKLENWRFDALVVTNTTSYLATTWYKLALFLSPMDSFVDAKADVPYMRQVNSTKLSDGPGSITRYRPDLSSIKELVQSTEDFLSKGKKSKLGKQGIARNTRLILRVDGTDDDVHLFAKELSQVLTGTRFDPASITTTVLRDEGLNHTWGPAFYIAKEVKDVLESSLPRGCLYEHSVCRDLRECVSREARGELVICEDVVPPEEPAILKIERGVKDGLWSWYARNVLSWTEKLLDELEARLWLLYCKPEMLWSSDSSTARCEKAIVSLNSSDADAGLGVSIDYVGVSSTILYTLSRYWVAGDTTVAMTHIPSYWFGFENWMKIFTCMVSKGLGKELYAMGVELAVELFAKEYGPLSDWLNVPEKKEELPAVESGTVVENKGSNTKEEGRSQSTRLI